LKSGTGGGLRRVNVDECSLLNASTLAGGAGMDRNAFFGFAMSSDLETRAAFLAQVAGHGGLPV
jgi:hypothetical protein